MMRKSLPGFAATFLAVGLALANGTDTDTDADAAASGGCTGATELATPAPPSALDLPDYGSDANADEISDPRQQAAESAWQDYQRATFDALGKSRVPRDWALAALTGMELSGDASLPARRAALLERAVRTAPDDVLVQWIGAQAAKDQGVSLIANARLQRLEPDNAAVWLNNLREATQQGERSVELALAKAASGSRYELHYAQLMMALEELYQRYPPPAVDWPASEPDQAFPRELIPFTQAVSVAAAFAFPPFQQLIDACRMASDRSPVRAADCAAIGRLMVAHGDTAIANRIGYTVLRVSRAYTEQDIQGARNDDWVYTRAVALETEKFDAASVRRMLALQRDWIDSGSELDAMRRTLANAGIAPVPPDDWTDDHPLFSAERLKADEDWLRKHPTTSR